MSLPWVKLRVSLVDNDTFKALTPGAKLTFYTALAIAQKQDQGGRLFVRGFGPMKAAQIASYTGMGVKRQQESIDELCIEERFFSVDLTGTLTVIRFDEMAGEEAHITARRERQAAYMARKRSTESTPTSTVDKSPIKDIDVDIDKELAERHDALRTEAVKFGTWPKEVPFLSALSLIFLARFANCHDPKKAAKFVRSYAGTLSRFQQRGATIAEAWTACERSWSVGNGAPMWSANSALDHLPRSKQPGSAPSPNYKNLRAEGSE